MKVYTIKHCLVQNEDCERFPLKFYDNFFYFMFMFRILILKTLLAIDYIINTLSVKLIYHKVIFRISVHITFKSMFI